MGIGVAKVSWIPGSARTDWLHLEVAEDRNATMTDTLDAALESLRRECFYEEMATAEKRLRSDPGAWETYVRERDQWLNPDVEVS